MSAPWLRLLPEPVSPVRRRRDRSLSARLVSALARVRRLEAREDVDGWRGRALAAERDVGFYRPRLAELQAERDELQERVAWGEARLVEYLTSGRPR